MSCAPSANVCQPRAFTLFQTCDVGVSAKCATNDWKICKEGDKTTVELDCGYKLQFDEKHSEMYIIKPCGEKTRIWGDPHVDVKADGKNDFDFYGTTSFQLKDGTKITINTEPWKHNPGMTLANNVVVTKGEKSLIVDGLSQNCIGDFRIEKGLNGCELDKKVWDGKLTIHENPCGPGWVDETGGKVDQHDGNRSKIECGDPKQLGFFDQYKTIKEHDCAPKANDCAPKYCFTWLEAMAAAFGNVLTKQVEKMNWIYKNLNACYAIGEGTKCTKEQYDAYCEAMKGMGKEVKSWEQVQKDGSYTITKEDSEALAKGQVYWQQLLTGAAQQFQLSAQTGMTVQNSVSQGLNTVSRAG